jgi:CelD/BcsL family acetyltransferase involved in cellulose biosynthesis
MTGISIRVLEGFGDPSFGPHQWQQLAGERASVFQTWHWQDAWWQTFGRGRLLLILAERDGRAVTFAPLFADGGMVFFTGSGGSDYLDFLGDTGDHEALAAILRTARDCVDGFLGFRFYHVPDDSPAGAHLAAAASVLGLNFYDEGELPAPALDLTDRMAAEAAARKTSLLRHERALQRDGTLVIDHQRKGSAILPYLDEFFEQHRTRWEATPYPSLFLDPAQRTFYRKLCEGGATWLRFTRVIWNGRTVACHFGFCLRGRFLWYKPSFAIDLARYSPGEVLLRSLLLAAMEEGAPTFDFGLGDEAFKKRFATHTRLVRTWGLYPAAKPAVKPDAEVVEA